MTNGRTRDAAGHIDIVSCGTGFPSDTGVLTLLEEADAVYGSRSLMALCPVPVKNARIIGSGARKDAEEVLALGREGKRIVVLASGDALSVIRASCPESPAPSACGGRSLIHI